MFKFIIFFVNNFFVTIFAICLLKNCRGAPQKGIPGVPGATELEAALKRLTPAEVLARRTNLQHGPAFGG